MRVLGHLRILGLMLALMHLGGSACKKSRPQRSGSAPAVVIRSPDASAILGRAEHEPNDSYAQAELLGEGPTWRIVGALGDPNQGKGDVDIFQITIPPDGSQPGGQPSTDGGVDLRTSRLSLALLAGAASNLVLQVQDEREQVVASLSCIRGSETAVPNIAVIPGRRYFLRLNATGKSGKTVAFDAGVAASTYTLTAESGQFGPGDEREPNNEVSTAESIGPFAGTVERAGYLSQTRDEDWYRIPLPTIPSSLGSEVGSVEGVAIGLKIVNARGNKLASAVGHRSSKVLLRNVRLPSGNADGGVESEALFLVVFAAAGQNREDRYVVRLNLGPLETGIEVEPNDNPSQGTVVEEGTITGYMSRDDVDFFRLQTHPNQTVEIRLVPPSRVRLAMEINRLSDGQSMGREASKTKGRALNATISSGAEDTFLIRISSPKGAGNPNQPYTLSIVILRALNPAFPPKPKQ